MKKTINAILIVAGISMGGCNSLIDLQPESIISVNSFWKTAEDAQGGLYGMYTQFRTFAQSELILLGEARSEVMGHGIQNADYRIKYFENTLTASNADRNWLQLYRIINSANLVIKYVPGISFSNDQNKNKTLAQAYAMRAYCYFVLARTWGDVPIVLDPVEGYNPETTFKVRSPQAEVFALIKSDIETALPLFTNNQFENGRSLWSKPAVNLLKADVFLWTAKRNGGGNTDATTALQALNDAESADVGLLDNFSQVFAYGNKGNREIILAVRFADLEATTNFYADMYIGPSDLPASADDDVKQAIGTPGGLNWWAPTSTMRNQFKTDDTRRAASFVEIYRNDNGNRTFQTSVVVKGKGFVEAGARRFLDDIVIYRYADLILLKAEAKNLLGQNPSEEINKIRQRAYGTNFPSHAYTSGTVAENDEVILQERLFEFAFEGKRWWDLVRFGKAFEKVPSLQGKEGQQHLLLWPLTVEALSLNSKLTQTNGY